jgi:YbgC/YbaW family acyl-CoA thioester hydrolase
MLGEHRIRRRVLFHETDCAGVVHFSCFFKYMEEVEHALWREAGLSIAPEGAPVAYPRVSAAFEFHRPLKFDDEFDAEIRITAITEKTMAYACTLWRGQMRVASGTMTIACVSTQAGQPMKAMAFPPEIIGRFHVIPGAGA